MKTLNCTANKCSKVHDVIQWRMTLHCNSHDTMKSWSNIQTSLDCKCLPFWMVFKRLRCDWAVRMPCKVMQTDKNDMKVEKNISMHSHAFERPCKRQIVTTKSRYASHMNNTTITCVSWKKISWTFASQTSGLCHKTAWFTDFSTLSACIHNSNLWVLNSF